MARRGTTRAKPTRAARAYRGRCARRTAARACQLAPTLPRSRLSRASPDAFPDCEQRPVAVHELGVVGHVLDQLVELDAVELCRVIAVPERLDDDVLPADPRREQDVHCLGRGEWWTERREPRARLADRLVRVRVPD